MNETHGAVKREAEYYSQKVNAWYNRDRKKRTRTEGLVFFSRLYDGAPYLWYNELITKKG